MHALNIGAPYINGITSWPDGNAEYNYLSTGHELRIFWASPTEAEIEAVRRAPMHLGLFVDGSVIDLVWRIEGAGGWSDTPFSIHQVPEASRAIPDATTGEERALLTVLLVDAATGILKAIRALSIPPHATERLHAAIRAQAAAPWEGREAHLAEIAAIYRRYPDSQDLALAAEVLVRGGT